MVEYIYVQRTDKQMRADIKNHIKRLYDGSTVLYCQINKLDYSGVRRALKGTREISDRMAAPLGFKKKNGPSFFSRREFKDDD